MVTGTTSSLCALSFGSFGVSLSVEDDSFPCSLEISTEFSRLFCSGVDFGASEEPEDS